MRRTSPRPGVVEARRAVFGVATQEAAEQAAVGLAVGRAAVDDLGGHRPAPAGRRPGFRAQSTATNAGSRSASSVIRAHLGVGGRSRSATQHRLRAQTEVSCARVVRPSLARAPRAASFGDRLDPRGFVVPLGVGREFVRKTGVGAAPGTSWARSRGAATSGRTGNGVAVENDLAAIVSRTSCTPPSRSTAPRI